MVTRRLRIEWRPGDKVTALLAMPGRPRRVGILLAHGAGAGQRSEFMAQMRTHLAAHRYPTMTFDYPYIEGGRKRPDHASVLEACHAAAAARLGDYAGTVVLAGKSMGGRIGGHIAAESGAGALVFFGYPFVSISGTVRDLGHLTDTTIPKLFVSGTRDRMGPTDIVRRAVASTPGAEAAIIDGGDHSLRVPKSAGVSNDALLAGIAELTAQWLYEGGLR